MAKPFDKKSASGKRPADADKGAAAKKQKVAGGGAKYPHKPSTGAKPSYTPSGNAPHTSSAPLNR